MHRQTGARVWTQEDIDILARGAHALEWADGGESTGGIPVTRDAQPVVA